MIMNEQKVEGGVNLKMKAPMTKTAIASMVVMIILGVLALSVVCMAIIPKSYAVALAEGNSCYLRVYKGSTTSVCQVYNDNTDSDKKSDEQELYDMLIESIDSSFSTTSLNALFQKQLSNSVTYKYIGTNSVTLNKIVTGNEYVVEYVFATEQVLQKDSKDYICEELKNSSSLYENGIVKFKKIWMTVNNVDGISQVKYYIQRRVSENSSQSSYAVIEITTKASQASIVKALQDVIDAKNI